MQVEKCDPKYWEQNGVPHSPAKFAKQYNFGNILGGWHTFKVNQLDYFLKSSIAKSTFNGSQVLYLTSYRKWIKKKRKKRF